MTLASGKASAPVPGKKQVVYIIEDEPLMARCIENAVKKADFDLAVRKFRNAIDAVNNISDDPPALIFLDVLLPGPDGFTLLNELVSYDDTAKIPVVIVSSLDFRKQDLKKYGVVASLDKTTMLPQDITALTKQFLGSEANDAK